MKTFWRNFKQFAFTYQFSYFDLVMLWSIITIAEAHGWWWALLSIPMGFFSAAMRIRVMKEINNAQASNGTAQ